MRWARPEVNGVLLIFATKEIALDDFYRNLQSIFILGY